MSKIINLTDQRFGRWQAISFAGIHRGGATWNCVCDCGTKRIVPTERLRQGNSKSCGCANVGRTHGIAATYHKGCRCNPCKDAAKQYRRNKLAGRRQFLIDAKKKPCADCGNDFPWYCMDFDHLPSKGDKAFTLSRWRHWDHDDKTIRAELAKCEVVCSNCHRKRTHERQSYYGKLGNLADTT